MIHRIAQRFGPTLAATTIAFGVLTVYGKAYAQAPQQRVAQIAEEHSDSLADLCHALDREILETLPAWSDSDLRWALFGVPTNEERARLKERSAELASLLGAMQPLLEDRLTEADRENREGIDQAVQLSEVLIPLARARGLLLTAAAIDPALTNSPEAQRGFEQARRLAEQSESVSAWSDLERELIIAIASLRLSDANRAVESIRDAREALRENQNLAASSPESVLTLRAAEALLVAVARSPVEAREALPDDPEDQERLRLRFTVIAARMAQTADARHRILRVATDRLADEALTMGRNNSFESTAWIEPLNRCAALLSAIDPATVGEMAEHAVLLSEFASSNGEFTSVSDFGVLQPLAYALELRAIKSYPDEIIDFHRLTTIGLGLDRLASGTPLGESGLERISRLLNEPSVGKNLRENGSGQERLLDLLNTVILRPGFSRSNMHLMELFSFMPSDIEAHQRGISQKAEFYLELARGLDPLDRDAVITLQTAGAQLVDALLREQLDSLQDGESSVSPGEQSRAINALKELAAALQGTDTQQDFLAVMHLVGLANPKEDLAILRSIKTEYVADWGIEMLTTRAELLAGELPTGQVSDGTVFGSALFVDHDLPANTDIQTTVPDLARAETQSGSPLAAGSVLCTRRGIYTQLAIRAYSVALETNDAQQLADLVEATEQAAAKVEQPQDREWLRLIHADALLKQNKTAEAFAVYRDLVATTAPEDRNSRRYWHASMRMLEVLAKQNADGSRTPAIAREIRRLRLQPSWGTHADICDRIDTISKQVIGTSGE